MRAVAVAAVIAYHVGWLKGGFLGVDVFFVLSGYLITTLLLRELTVNGGVRLAEFWTRRARRLLPAVLFLLCVTSAEVAHTGAVATFAARRGDILATLFYYANWHFIATDQSYFAAYSGVSPLRHMWSLAIEEQFYLVWPVLLLVSYRLARRALLPLVVAGIAASAGAMAVEYTSLNPSRAYFGTDTRAQVLLCGAALAIVLWRNPDAMLSQRAVAAARYLSPVCAVGIIVAFVVCRSEAAYFYKGGATGFAVLTAIALWAVESQPNAIVPRLLSLQPIRWVGWISYSLYLWHWPIIVWLGPHQVTGSPLADRIVEILATIVCATFSFYVIERPVRYGKVPWLGFSKRRFAVVVALTVAAVAGVGVAATRSPHLVTAESNCTPGSPGIGIYTWCVRVSPTSLSAPVVATVGDSTSLSLDPGMQEVAAARRWRYVQAGHGGCSALPLVFPRALDTARVAQAEQCESVISRVLPQVEAEYSPTVWILSDRTLLQPVRLTDGTVVQPETRRHDELIQRSLRATLAFLARGGSSVVVLAVAPTGAPVQCGASVEGSCASLTWSLQDPLTARIDGDMRRVVRTMRNPGVVLVSISDVLCPSSGRCPADVQGELARYDGTHFTRQFSQRIVPIIVRRALAAGVRFDLPHRKLSPQIASPQNAGG